MAKAVADVDNPDEEQGGFASDNSDIVGFSHMHDDGTGGVGFQNSYMNELSDQVFRHLPLEISRSSLNQDVLEMISTTATSRKMNVLASVSMAPFKPYLDILQSA